MSTSNNPSDAPQPTPTTSSSSEGKVTSTSEAASTEADVASTPSFSSATVDEGAYTITSKTSGKSLDISGGSMSDGANVQIFDANSTQAQRWRVVKADGHYIIYSAVSGLALDVAGAGMASGTNVQVYEANGTKAQLWDFLKDENGSFALRSVLNGLMLDVSGGGTANGSNVQVYSSNGTAAQLWTLSRVASTIASGVYTVKSAVNAGMVLDVAGGSVDDGAAVQLYASNGSSAQKWDVAYDSRTGYYTVKSAVSGKVLDIPGANRSSGTSLWQYAANGTAAQLWSIRTNSDGTWSLSSALNGMAVDLSGALAKNGGRVQTWDPNGSKAQRWVLSAASLLDGGLYQLVNSIDSMRVIDVDGASTASDAKVQIWDKNGTLAQKWVIAKLSGGAYSIMNANSGLFLTEGKSSLVGASSVTGSGQWRVSLGSIGGLVFKNVISGKALDLSGGIASLGRLVSTYAPNGTKAQIWRALVADALEEGTYSFLNLADTNQALDAPEESKTPRTALHLYDKDGASAQKWRVSSAGSGWYTIMSLSTGLYVDVRDAKSLSGTVVQEDTANGSDAQLWRFSIGTHGGIVIISKIETSSSTGLAIGSSGTNDTAARNGSIAVYVIGSNNSRACAWRIEKYASLNYIDEDTIEGSWKNDASYVSGITNKARSLSTDTGSIIVTDRSTCRVLVFDANSGCKLVKAFDSNLGTAEHPTFTGTYRINHKWESGASNPYFTVYFDYWVNNDGTGAHNAANDDGQGFHDAYDGTPGYESHGCTRLYHENAKWIFDNVSIGSTVYIF
ncbi:MAG: RICIN domain-containing protein [Atopobiaceae bacterium]|nr:RICIN domain-containing protein [Atopobiaceae bacterium]